MLRDWARAEGGRQLADSLLLDGRQLEAAWHYQAASRHRSAPSRAAAAWSRWVEAAAAAAPRRARKCLRRDCVEGLQQAFDAGVFTDADDAGVLSADDAHGGVAALAAPFTSAQVAALTTAATAGEPVQCPAWTARVRGRVSCPNPNP